MRFLQNRIVMALFGFIVVGVLGAIAMTRPPTHASVQATPTLQTAAANTPTQPPQATLTATTDTTVPTPTDVIPRATDTPTSTRTPTQTPTTQTALRGTIGTVTTANGGSFTLNVSGGGTKTVVVDSKTSYQNVSNFNSLHSGMVVKVTGSTMSGGNFLATIVQVQIDN